MPKTIAIDRLLSSSIDTRSLIVGSDLRISGAIDVGAVNCTGLNALGITATSAAVASLTSNTLTAGTVSASSIQCSGPVSAGAASFQSVACSGGVTAGTVSATTLAAGAVAANDFSCSNANITALETSNIKLNDASYNPFPKNVIALYEFADPNFIGTDSSGRQKHARPMGVRPIGTFTTAEQATGTVDVNSKTFPNAMYCNQSNNGNAKSFYNGSQYLDISPLVPDLLAAKDFTISLWFKTSTPSYAQTLFFAGCPSVSTSTNAVGVHVYCHPTYGFIFQCNPFVLRWKASGGLTANKWYHVVFSVGPSVTAGAKVYVDGVQGYVGGTSGTLDWTTTLAKVHATETANTALIGNYMYPSVAGGTVDMLQNLCLGSFANVFIFSGSPTQALVNELYQGNYGYDIYPLLGGENMVGAPDITAGIDDDLSVLNGRVYQYTTSITAAAQPLSFDFHSTTLRILTVSMGASLWRTFAKEVLAKTHPLRRVLLVPCAKAKTSFRGNNATCLGDPSSGNSWNPTDALFTAAVARINNAVNTFQPVNRIVGLLWHQGEMDSTNVMYGCHFRQFLDSLYSSLSISKATVPIILGEPIASPVSAGAQQMVGADKSVYISSYVTTSDLASSSGVFTKEAVRTLGTRYATALQNLLCKVDMDAYEGIRAYTRSQLTLPTTTFKNLQYSFEMAQGTGITLSLLKTLSVVAPSADLAVVSLPGTLPTSNLGFLKVVYNTGGVGGTLSITLRTYTVNTTYTEYVVPAGTRKDFVWLGNRWTVA